MLVQGIMAITTMLILPELAHRDLQNKVMIRCRFADDLLLFVQWHGEVSAWGVRETRIRGVMLPIKYLINYLATHKIGRRGSRQMKLVDNFLCLIINM